MSVITVHSSGTLTWGETTYRCALGRNGVTSSKREGDGATPLGCFPLRRIYYRVGRIKSPLGSLPIESLNPDDAWCDDPEDVAYNLAVKLPYPGHTESLWRQDNLYDICVVVGYNDDPVIRGHGSAIFLHAASPDFAATSGCIAIKREHLLDIVITFKSESLLRIID